MQIDELRGELTALADEIEPFEGDVRSLHRRQRRRHVVTASLVAALAVVVGVSAVAVSHRGNGRVHVAAGSKEVAVAQMSHIDAIVVPATPTVAKILDASPLVRAYARIPRGYRGAKDAPIVPAADARCALETSDGLVVALAGMGTELPGQLRSALAGKAIVFDTLDTLGSDIELFMTVGAPHAEVESVLSQLKAEPGIASFVFISQEDAYSIFKRDFADQPTLVQSTKPSDLPASFRIILKPDVSVAATAARYRRLDGVDSAITLTASRQSLLISPASLVGQTSPSACAKG